MKNIFVFPCGSEIALEIARALKDNRHFHLIGGSSVSDHGRFEFPDIVENLPWEDHPDFIPMIQKVVVGKKIDLIYPAMDSSLVVLKENESRLGATVIGSPIETNYICLSKKKTYEILRNTVTCPKIFTSYHMLQYPVFGKPEVGYGARGVRILHNSDELNQYIQSSPNHIICEYLPGEEYTVDCFTDRHGTLLFCGPRIRNRVVNGISVNTSPVDDSMKGEFVKLAEKINQKIMFRGAWFFQMKRNKNGDLVLLEIAARFGGSSSLYRGLGVNFAELSIWDVCDFDVSVCPNKFPIEVDRALDVRYKLDIDYNEVFLDYDDTLMLNQKYYNSELFSFLFQCRNYGIKVTLLSKHDGDLQKELEKFYIDRLFDRVIHIGREENKSSFIDNPQGIFIDDSFAERQSVALRKQIPVFGLDMIRALYENLSVRTLN